MPHHNHEASDRPKAHPSQRRLDAEEQAQLAALSLAVVKHRNIALTLLGEGDVSEQHPVKLRDVYNARH